MPLGLFIDETSYGFVPARSPPYVNVLPLLDRTSFAWCPRLLRCNAGVSTGSHQQHGPAALPIGSQHWFIDSTRSTDGHTSGHQNNGRQREHSTGCRAPLHCALLQWKRVRYSRCYLPLVNYFTQPLQPSSRRVQETLKRARWGSTVSPRDCCAYRPSVALDRGEVCGIGCTSKPSGLPHSALRGICPPWARSRKKAMERPDHEREDPRPRSP